MTKWQKDFYNKTLLMLALAGAILGVAHAGYDGGSLSGQFPQANIQSDVSR